MRALRIIHRFDFKRNFEIMNSPGTVASLLEAGSPTDFFAEFGEDRNARRAMARRLSSDKRTFHSVTVEPTAVVLDIERSEGILLNKLGDDQSFKDLLKIGQSVMEKFKINEFVRAGLRLFVFDSIFHNHKKTLDRFNQLNDAGLHSLVTKHLGNTTDCAVVFDGQSDAKVNYKFRAGPFLGKDETRKYLASIDEAFLEQTELDLVVDIDMFELNFNYGTKAVGKWWLPLAQTADISCSKFRDYLRNE